MPEITGSYSSHAFHCGVCNAGFDTREEREAHKYRAHPGHYAELEKPRRERPMVAAMERRNPMQGGKGNGYSLPSKSDAPTEKQLAYLNSLREKHGVDTPIPTTKREVSTEIDRLKNLPKPTQQATKKASTATLPDVPAGRYALDGTGENATVFYKVDRPTEGKWAGYTFVKRVIGGQPEDRVPFPQTAGILQRILDADPMEAMQRYGREIGSCGRCGRTLTNDKSRKLGIGPECINKA